MGNQIHFTSLGCSRNLVDTEIMLGIVLKAGYEIAMQMNEADFLVVNTCGFLKGARQEALDLLEEIFEIKKESARVIVVGCMVQSHQQMIEKQFPQIHYYLGAGDVDQILQSLTSSEQGQVITKAKSFIQQGEVPRLLSTPPHFGYLKIAEGCRKRCSFCIIPHIKGKLKSKSVDQVKKEFQALLSSGCQEIILIAQDLGDYGKETREKTTLVQLLRELLKEKGNYWIRLLYLYPDEITDELIALIKSDSRLLPYLDMPIQHINDEILKRMHRKTSRTHIVETIAKLRKDIPDIVIRTSLMVGFPGETKEQFEELLQFVKEAKLDNIGIFKYSKEEESYSAKLPNHIDEKVKQERFEELALVQQDVAIENGQKLIGRELEVIIEGFHPDSEHLMVGRYYGQAPDIDGVVIINDTSGVKEFHERYLVEITDSIGYDLIGYVKRPLAKRTLKKRSSLALIG